VGKGAFAPCPPSIGSVSDWWARFRLRSLSYGGRCRFAHPTSGRVIAVSQRQSARAVHQRVPQIDKGAGNAGCPLHPQPRVRIEKAHERSHHRYAETLRHSPRDGFNGLFRALPGDRALLPSSSAQGSPPRKLDASVGASGPHDFAVRISIARLAKPSRPPHPAPNVRDDREAPLLSRRDDASKPRFLISRNTNIFARGTGHPNQLEMLYENRVLAHGIFVSLGGASEAAC
jgi:hypothetical protein